MPTIDPKPLPCPRCGANMGPHCMRTVPKHGGTKAKACGWAICPKAQCRTVVRLKDRRVLPAASESSK